MLNNKEVIYMYIYIAIYKSCGIKTEIYVGVKILTEYGVIPSYLLFCQFL